MNSLQTRQLVIIGVDAQTKEEPCIATIYNLVIAKLKIGPTCQNKLSEKLTTPHWPPPTPQHSARRGTERVITNEGGGLHIYLDKVTLVALVTRGYETVYFAFDLVLLVILFGGDQRIGYYFGEYFDLVEGKAKVGEVRKGRRRLCTSYGSYHFDNRVLDCRFWTRMNLIYPSCISEVR